MGPVSLHEESKRKVGANSRIKEGGGIKVKKPLEDHSSSPQAINFGDGDKVGPHKA